MVHTRAYKTTIKYFTPTKKKRKLKLSDMTTLLDEIDTKLARFNIMLHNAVRARYSIAFHIPIHSFLKSISSPHLSSKLDMSVFI